ncbi:MAG: hypothetical protein Fur0022_01830 [Anaerolineales bacterium]
MQRLSEPGPTTIRRLQSAAGHLNGVIRMAEREAPGVEVLHQLCAVQAALRAIGCQLLEEHMENQLEMIEQNCSCQNREQLMENLKGFYALLAKSEVF